ncbi:MAG: hypothetical protein E7Z89_05355 [Cyanobacteria bacterium SIG28]|nr:hypothetical protein [Cyanobacteria bacterium SIG28]
MQDNNIKYFLIIFVVLCFIYSFFFAIRRAHFVCNENECKIEQLNTFGKLRNTIDVNWDEIEDFEIGTMYDSSIRRRNLSLRKRIRYFVGARLNDRSEINFFGITTRNEYTVRNVTNHLRKCLNQTTPLNIDITFP